MQPAYEPWLHPDVVAHVRPENIETASNEKQQKVRSLGNLSVRLGVLASAGLYTWFKARAAADFASMGTARRCGPLNAHATAAVSRHVNAGARSGLGRGAPKAVPLHVAVATVGGGILTGKIQRFTPHVAELALDVDAGAMKFLATERIVYVGFRALETDHVREKCERTKVHIAGGRVFVVDVPKSPHDRLGFFGYATEAGTFSHYYFYAHGVIACERDVRLGEMLLEGGVLAQVELERGVRAQTDLRAVPVGKILVEQGVVEEPDVTAALALQERRKLRLGQVLVESGLATEEAIERALVEQKRRKGKRIGEVLVEMGVIREEDLTRTLASKFQLPFVDLDTLEPDGSALEALDRDLIVRWGVVPLASTPSRVTVAFGDPLAVDAIDAVRVAARRRVDEVLVMPTQLRRHIVEHLARLDAKQARASAEQFDALLTTLKVEDIRAESEEEEERDGLISREDEGGIVKLVNQVIIDAYRRGASDIHIEPNGKDDVLLIRFRVDGECTPYQAVPGTYRNQIVARVKIMAALDISERRKPQDGKIRFRVGDRMIELRVAILPTVNGNEDVVLRVLASAKPLPLERLGLSDHNLAALKHVMHQPHGLVLCVGPTGSGKTTTLHSALGAINDQATKIWTAEDPVEITQVGLRQVQVQPKIGFTFAAAMRAFLRADPDVIMVGEMRDRETADTAVEASLTGHLVLSTLHTNSAPETITRLLDMGLDPFGFADSLLAILAQRLVRSLCLVCREPGRGDERDIAELATAYGRDEDALATDFALNLGELRLYRAKGCEACGGTGYKGRIAIHELLVVDAAIRAAISRRAPAAEIRELAAARGMRSLLADGVAKVLSGATDITQVLSVAGA
jgi:type II secretory ATPase GspE/PulE/Tfp pilus assembly ATPase PilB-like protein